MSITRWNLEHLLTNLENRLQLVNKQISQYPCGHLMQTYRDGKKVYFQVVSYSAGRKRISINKKPDLVAGLSRKKYLEMEADMLTDNISALNSLLDSYMDITADNILKLLPQRYRELPESYFFTAYDDPAGLSREFQDWANQDYEQSTYRPWEKTHTTSTGLKVRSKSEVIIAEKLDFHKLPFRYEQMVYFQQYSFSPDFIVMTKHELKYWEHCGKVNDTAYMKHHNWKISMYEKMGIVPWKNLIITYDDPLGGIDSRIIESEIINKLM